MMIKQLKGTSVECEHKVRESSKVEIQDKPWAKKSKQNLLKAQWGNADPSKAKPASVHRYRDLNQLFLHYIHHQQVKGNLCI
ncbi:hypothetical protein OPV22_022234 [Ensete ventricosum]|uniref:Uncharacterized protein n=1 Tax=Ensete ventricosum TaxID=4639 RepID=A0AAV8QSF6_ENSVE|nr:hypothetical protein OPV22_022234 [Ensete ventricosum]